LSESLNGYSVVNLEPRDITSWTYDDDRDAPYLNIDVHTHLMDGKLKITVD